LALGLAGLVLGHVAAADDGAPRPGMIGNALGFAGGGLWVGVAILAFAVHTLQPLPMTNQVIPALVGLSLALAGLAPADREAVGPAWSSPGLRWALGSMVVAAFVVPAGVSLAWPSTAKAAADGDRLRVMTFNIDQGVTDGRLDLEQLARSIEAEDPDVVVLEEVGRGWALSGMTDEGAWFSRRLRMPFVWAPAADDQFGNVVLSRVPITSSSVLDLGKGNGTQARSAALVHLDLNGRDVLVIGTHLMNGSSEPMHVSRAEAYDAILAAWGGAPDTVLLGDMNTYPRLVEPGWPELDIPLVAGFTTTQDTDLCTLPTSNRNCPDWIFAGPGVVSSPVWLGADRPDHRPVVADVSFG
jgi:endonuclease/exonuclease/phosphatase family metal-dependent hydrolase